MREKMKMASRDPAASRVLKEIRAILERMEQRLKVIEDIMQPIKKDGKQLLKD
jgi:hypothetical protein